MPKNAKPSTIVVQKSGVIPKDRLGDLYLLGRAIGYTFPFAKNKDEQMTQLSSLLSKIMSYSNINLSVYPENIKIEPNGDFKIVGFQASELARIGAKLGELESRVNADRPTFTEVEHSADYLILRDPKKKSKVHFREPLNDEHRELRKTYLAHIEASENQFHNNPLMLTTAQLRELRADIEKMRVEMHKYESNIKSSHPISSTGLTRLFEQNDRLLGGIEDRLKNAAPFDMTASMNSDLTRIRENPAMLPTSQDWFIDPLQKAGHVGNTGGMCFGVAHLAVQDFLGNRNMDAFHESFRLLAAYKDKPFELIQMIAAVQDKMKTKIDEQGKRIPGTPYEKLTDNEKMLARMPAVHDALELYMQGNLHDELYTSRNTRQTVRPILDLLTPDALKEKEGKIEPLNVAGRKNGYSQSEYALVLSNLEGMLKDAQLPIAFSICSPEHAINVNYDAKTKTWMYIDPNYLPGETGLTSSEVTQRLFEKGLNFTNPHNPNPQIRVTTAPYLHENADNKAQVALITKEYDAWMYNQDHYRPSSDFAANISEETAIKVPSSAPIEPAAPITAAAAQIQDSNAPKKPNETDATLALAKATPHVEAVAKTVDTEAKKIPAASAKIPAAPNEAVERKESTADLIENMAIPLLRKILAALSKIQDDPNFKNHPIKIKYDNLVTNFDIIINGINELDEAKQKEILTAIEKSISTHLPAIKKALSSVAPIKQADQASVAATSKVEDQITPDVKKPNTAKKAPSTASATTQTKPDKIQASNAKPVFSDNRFVQAFIEKRVSSIQNLLLKYKAPLNEAIKKKDKHDITKFMQHLANVQQRLLSYKDYMEKNNLDPSPILKTLQQVNDGIAYIHTACKDAKISIKDDRLKLSAIPNNSKDYPGAMIHFIEKHLKSYDSRIDGLTDDIHKSKPERPYEKIKQEGEQMRGELAIYKSFLEQNKEANKSQIKQVDMMIHALDRLITKSVLDSSIQSEAAPEDNKSKAMESGISRKQMADNAASKNLNSIAIELFRNNADISPSKLNDLGNLISSFEAKMEKIKHPISDDVDNYLHLLNNDIKKDIGVSLSSDERKHVWNVIQNKQVKNALGALNNPSNPQEAIKKQMENINSLIQNCATPQQVDSEVKALQSAFDAIRALDRTHLAALFSVDPDQCKKIRDDLEKGFDRVQKNASAYTPEKRDQNINVNLDKMVAYVKALYTQPPTKTHDQWRKIHDQLNKYSHDLKAFDCPTRLESKLKDLRERVYQAQGHVAKEMSAVMSAGPSMHQKK